MRAEGPVKNAPEGRHLPDSPEMIPDIPDSPDSKVLRTAGDCCLLNHNSL